MANLGMMFNANEVQGERMEFGTLPPGQYTVAITDSTMKATKSGTGEYLQLEMEVQAGPMQGRKLWERLNLQNPNAQAVDIARRTLKEICLACNRPIIQASEELHGIPMLADVKIEKGKDGNNDTNRVSKYHPASAYQPQQAPVQSTQQAAAAQQAYSNTAMQAQQAARPAPAAPAGGAPWARK